MPLVMDSKLFWAVKAVNIKVNRFGQMRKAERASKYDSAKGESQVRMQGRGLGWWWWWCESVGWQGGATLQTEV